jgi:hypothetical protein
VNIFATDKNPIIAAQNLCDSHVIKMVLESAQMMCTYLNENGVQTSYRSTHKNHPCSLWLKESSLNRSWLFEHYYALLQEFRMRRDKRHKCTDLLGLFYANFHYDDALDVLLNSRLNFALAMPNQYRSSDPIESYRNYYISKQYTMKVPMRWTKRQPPDWFVKEAVCV